MYEKKFVLEINTEKSNEVHIWLNFLTAAKIHHKHHVMLIISIRCAFVGSSRIVQNKAAVRSSTARLHGFAARVQFQNSKFQKKNRHPHGDLNLDEIKNALRLLFVNGETNLMNLVRL